MTKFNTLPEMAAAETRSNSPLADWQALFFFQAEDGIRGICVTGVQTCALPISPQRPPDRASDAGVRDRVAGGGAAGVAARSEERRVGKGGRSRWAPKQ